VSSQEQKRKQIKEKFNIREKRILQKDKNKWHRFYQNSEKFQNSL